MNRRRVVLPALAGCLALVASAAARAQAPESYARNGVYVAAAGSVGIYSELEDELPDDGDVDEPIGLNAQVGYRFHPLAAAELGMEWLPEADVEVFGVDAGSVESWTAMVDGKGYWLTGRVQPFGLLGLGAMIAKASGAGLSDTEYDFAARFGGGIDVYLTAKLVASLSVSYVLPTGDLEDLDYVSLGWGLAWRF